MCSIKHSSQPDANNAWRLLAVHLFHKAPPTHHFDMSIAPEFQQPFESQTQTNTHPQTFTDIYTTNIPSSTTTISGSKFWSIE
ncbi:hypothetical protein Lal_00010115 [Lupinus albus]|nr:hypothetical protein Lal_00010115 [Lupinus albus]